MRTWLGGVCWVPKAERKNDKTTMNRINEVIIIKIDGAKAKTVLNLKNKYCFSYSSGFKPPKPPTFTFDCLSNNDGRL